MSFYNVNLTFDSIERLGTAQTPDALIGELAGVAAQFGFEATAIAALPHPDIPFEKRVLVHHWGNGWFEHYMAHDFAAADPVLHHAKTALRPFDWAEARFAPKSKAARVMHEAADFGFAVGFCVPTFTPHGPVNVTFGGRRSALSREDRGMLHLAAIYAQFRVTELLAGKLNGAAGSRPLSPREREVLQWCSAGKTTREVAEALRISPHTVLTHIASACRKLETPTRTAAVAKALHAGLI